MHDSAIRWRRLQAQWISKAFIVSELARARMSVRAPMRILFTEREGWSSNLRRRFRLVRDVACFGDLKTSALEAFDLVVPLSVEDALYLDSVRDRIPYNPIPVSSAQSIRLCNDKSAFNRHMAEHGFGDYLPDSGGAPGVPYVIKKRVDESARHIRVVADRAQDAAASVLLRDPDYFAQEFVAGSVEYATHVVFERGRVVCSLNVEYGFRESMPLKGRDDPAYMRLCRCPHLDLFAAILDSIGFEGLCCFNYKVRGGRPLVLEINPRFGRSLSGYFFAFMRHLAPGRG